MPRYRYLCGICDRTTDAIHAYKETLVDCEKCDSKESLKKILSTPYYGIKKASPQFDKKPGDITKKYIEENREILKQQKKEAKEKTYEPA